MESLGLSLQVQILHYSIFVSATQNLNNDFKLVRKLSFGIRYELHSSSEAGPIVLQAAQHPFSHKSTLWGPQQSPIILERKWLHIGNSFEYQGKQYRYVMPPSMQA